MPPAAQTLSLIHISSYANVENRLQMLIMNQTAEAMPAQTEESAYRKPRSSYQHPALSST